MASQDDDPILVALDAGTFAWLYSYVQGQATKHQWLESYRAITQRALLSFREAAGDLPEPEPAHKRVIPPKKVARKRTRK